jgi:hypothetical protein
LQVLGHKARGGLYDIDQLELQNDNAAGHLVELKEHLVSNGLLVSLVDVDAPGHYSLRERLDVRVL